MVTSSTQVKPMTSRERVLAALRREPVDRTPVCNPTSVATIELMDLVDAPFPQANRDPELMARLAATSYTELGFDTVMPVFTVIQESSAIGCKIQWEPKDNWPTVRMDEPIWRNFDEVKVPKNWMAHRDTQCVIEAIKILRKDLGDDVAVIGKSMGPWSIAYHTLGVENFLLWSLDDPDGTRRALDLLKPMTIEYAKMQFEAGADVITLPDHATGDLVSSDMYNDYLTELHQEMAAEIPGPIILHICGHTEDRMDYIAQTGMAAFHYDSKNDPQTSMDIVKGRIALVGNINNPQTLYFDGPEEVQAEVYKNLDAGVNMIGAECAIPLSTSIENLLAIPEAVRRWHEEKA